MDKNIIFKSLFNFIDNFFISSILKTVFFEIFGSFLAFTSSNTVETSSDIGVIAGSVMGVVLLVAAAVVAGILIHKKYQHN